MISMKITTNNLIPSTNKIKKALDKLPSEAYDVWHDNTPVRTGNARRKTKLRNDTIVAAYPYARRLDQGYSKQSPKGMAVPTEKFIRQRLKQIFKK